MNFEDYANKRYGKFCKVLSEASNRTFKSPHPKYNLSNLDTVSNYRFGYIIKAISDKGTTVEKVKNEIIGDYINGSIHLYKDTFGHVKTYNKKTNELRYYRLSSCFDKVVGQITIPEDEFELFENNTRYIFFDNDTYLVLDAKKINRSLGYQTGAGNISFQFSILFNLNKDCIVTFGKTLECGVVKENGVIVPYEEIQLNKWKFFKRKLSSSRLGYHLTGSKVALVKLVPDGDVVGQVFCSANALQSFLRKFKVKTTPQTINRHARDAAKRVFYSKRVLHFKIKKTCYMVLSAECLYEETYLKSLIARAYYSLHKYEDPEYIAVPRWSAYNSIRRFIAVKSSEELNYLKGLLFAFIGKKKKYSLHDLYLFMAEKFNPFEYSCDLEYNWYKNSRLKCQLTA